MRITPCLLFFDGYFNIIKCVIIYKTNVYRCFFRGNGGLVNVLRISGPQGYPDCGTQKVCTLNYDIINCNFMYLLSFQSTAIL